MLFGAGALAFTAFGLTACGRSESGSTATSSVTTAPGDDRSVATDAYVFGYPLVLMDVTREHGAPANRFEHSRTLPDAANRTLVRPNQDTLYSKAWLDLRTEPVVLEVPAMESGRYWLMETMDMWTNVAQNPSSVRPQLSSGATGGPFTYAFLPPGWNGTLPPGITPMPLPTPQAWILGRIQVDGQADLPAVHAIQDGLRIAPLSAWVANPGAGNPAAESPSTADAVQIVAGMDGRAFFDRMCALMAIDPPAPVDAPALQRFAALGITPGGSAGKIAAEVLDGAVADGRGRVENYRDPANTIIEGWNYSAAAGRYGTNYGQRAYVARMGLGGNLPEDALYPTYYGSVDGNGSMRLHFAPGQLPPVDAFWSITAYAADGFLIPNPASVYSVGHQLPVATNPDGSVDILIQNAHPTAQVAAANWLPIPEHGKFTLTMRLYAPQPTAIDHTWKPPAVTNT
ncbi:DUF1254 domain-containing protein [Nocardia sp. 2]|uniref:DUF1254 domain-containing protein n=2 Tax=Nocardia acididurans TaxID=2802282 RepID=A0ABS1MFT8_9NOCA|nr:DUF1254 domain-containing protein [Nocardia acididurans]